MAKTKNNNKKKSSNIHQEIRHLGVIIESVNDNVKLVAEQHGDIKGDINGIKKTLNSHTEMVGNLAVGLEVVKSDLEVVKSDLEVVKSDLEIVKGDVKTTKVDIEIIKADIEFIKNSVKKKIDVDEFAALERRVLILEKRR